MIIAMPMSRDRLASHFTKAHQIGFFNEQHQLISLMSNPALEGSGCSAKKAMLELIIQQQTDIVIVQHIGERMLGKLLDAGISVSKGDAQLGVTELLKSSQELNRRLLSASDGRASINHEKKGGCCGSDSHEGTGGGCCGSHSHEGAEAGGSCSGKKNTGGGCGCGSKAKSNAHPLNGAAQTPQHRNLRYGGFRKA